MNEAGGREWKGREREKESEQERKVAFLPREKRSRDGGAQRQCLHRHVRR